MGLLGLPIFSAGGGIGYILSPTFGFILGFIAAAWVTGKLTEKRGALRLMAACLLGTAVMYVIAIAYMTVILNSYLGKNLEFGYILQVGMLIYLPGDLLKCLLCALLGSRLAPVLRYNT
jgi:biotin transport system substrate-specific component